MFKLKSTDLIMFNEENSYSSIPLPTHPSNDCPKVNDHHASMEHSTEPRAGKKATKWSAQEEKLFFEFWLLEFKRCPQKSFSFDTPLRRSYHFKSLSQFLKIHGQYMKSEDEAKTETQCKSKFGTIRRKTHRNRKNNSSAPQIGFIDYILKAAQDIPSLQALAEEVKNMRSEESQMMKITKDIYLFEKSSPRQQQYEEIVSMLKKLNVKIDLPTLNKPSSKS